jgi:hypothetical protein
MAKHRAASPLPDSAIAEYVMYVTRIARRQLDAERTADAEALLAITQGLVAEHRAKDAMLETYVPDLARLRARAAVKRGALGEAAAAAEKAVGADDHRALSTAASAMSTVWQAARSSGVDATVWRDRTIELCQLAIDRLEQMPPATRHELWVAVPLAHTRILLALAQRDAGTGFDSAAVEQALDTLAGMRDDMHANEWDEDVFTAGKALLAR